MTAASEGARWRRWLTGRTMRVRLIAGLLALFLLASLGVGIATTVALSDFLLSQLDQQLAVSASMLTISIEHPAGPGSGTGPQERNPCRTAGENPALAAGQSLGTFAARLANGRVSYACIVTNAGGHTGLSSARLSATDLGVLMRLPRGHQPRTATLSGLGDYRLVAFAGQDGDVHVAGLPLAGLQATVRRLELIEVIVFGSALVAMGLAGTGWIRFSLRPLDRITAIATEVSDLPLGSGEVELAHRVPEADPRTEVGRLARALNQMLGHVAAAFAERQASEARLRQFVADASHELRTPLASIRGYTELALRASADLPADTRNALSRVDSASARMSRLVDDLLLLARLDAGRPLTREPVDLSRLVIDATSDARVAGRGHRWVLDLPGEPIVITGDQHRLYQVLANLLGNARAHTPRGTTVTVRLARVGDVTDDSAVEVTVTDDGPGIPADLQERVWERFARADAARSGVAGSTGLGLAIVRAVVTAHDGHVSLASRPGATTFRICLPAGASDQR